MGGSKNTGLWPRRPVFVSCVKPQVEVDLFVTQIPYLSYGNSSVILNQTAIFLSCSSLLPKPNYVNLFLNLSSFCQITSVLKLHHFLSYFNPNCDVFLNLSKKFCCLSLTKSIYS